jgi:ferric hydroxamate transport system ATP-binding protein
MAARFCNEIIALHYVRVIAFGSLEEIVTSSTLEAVYGIPMGVTFQPDSCYPICYVR